jgi:organic radical activating enzyme
MNYQVNEIFYSLQGEGIRAGEPCVFIRLSGCNLKCAVETHGFDCDTEFVSGRKMTADEIAGEVRACSNDRMGYVIFTGGEPGLQLDAALVKHLQAEGYQVGIETNGTVDVSGLPLDWVCVSPKVAEHAIKQLAAHEVKYVRGYGQGIPKTKVDAKHKLISPATVGDSIDERALAWCIELVKQNPDWRLSVQQHKLWRVR